MNRLFFAAAILATGASPALATEVRADMGREGIRFVTIADLHVADAPRAWPRPAEHDPCCDRATCAMRER